MNITDIEAVVLTSLLADEKYARAVLPFIKTEYFNQKTHGILYDEISSYFAKFNSLPTKEAIGIALDRRTDLSDAEFDSVLKGLGTLDPAKKQDSEWLIKETETFCRDRAIHNAIMESISILDGDDKQKRSKDALPGLLTDALGVSFDPRVGHDFIGDYEERCDQYHLKERKIPFDLKKLNEITCGGVSEKTLNVILAPTGVGKSMVMCHMAAANISMGYNVLYITCEMAEVRIGERIDANLMNLKINEMKELPPLMYKKKFEAAKKKMKAKLFIKEYPTGTPNVIHFRHLLDELRLKKKFLPDIIYVDYMNICSSARYKPGANNNSYTIVKSIAEELRGLAVENALPVITATQTNRAGATDSDYDMSATSESFGVPMTADILFGLVSTEQLDADQQILVNQLKNRYDAISPTNKRFLLGVDKPKMKLYDLDEEAQAELHENRSSSLSRPNSLQKSIFGDDDAQESPPVRERGKKYSGFQWK